MMMYAKTFVILKMFAQLMNKFHKHYLYLSQEKMLDLLRNYHQYPIRRRMLCYRLAELEAAGYIKRRQRNKRQVDGTIEPMTSLVFLTKRGWKQLTIQLKELARCLRGGASKIFRSPGHHADLRHDDVAPPQVARMYLKELKQLLGIV